MCAGQVLAGDGGQAERLRAPDALLKPIDLPPAPTKAVKEEGGFDPAVMPTEDLKKQIKISETALSHAENDALKAKPGSPAEVRSEKEIRQHIILMRDELATR